MQTETHFFKVAGLVFEAGLPDCETGPYEPFRIPAPGKDDTVIFRLEVRETGDPVPQYELIKCCNDEPPYLWIYRKPVGKDEVVFGFSFSKDAPFAVLEVPEADKQINEGACDCVLFLRKGLKRHETGCAVTNAMMLLYAMFGTPHGAMMMHASAVMYNGQGVIFLGKSGTGKSTHLQLWLDNIKGTERLNDDNPIVRIIDGKPYVFGSPWSGKTPCYKNKSLPLTAVVQLSQAPYNKITELDVLHAYTSLLSSCSSIRWRRDLTDCLHRSIAKVMEKCGVFHLECLPDADAAHICFNKVISE